MASLCRSIATGESDSDTGEDSDIRLQQSQDGGAPIASIAVEVSNIEPEAQDADGAPACEPMIERVRRRWSSSRVAEVSPEILRSVDLSRTLTCTGWSLWCRSPLDLDLRDTARLWDYSEQCAELDIFLSHSWQNPGWQKVLALLVHFYGRPAIVTGWALAALLFLLDLCGKLPTVEGKNVVTVHFSPWAPVPAMVSLMLMLLLPCWTGLRRRQAFFDAVCINQVDTPLKLKGIYSLPGILANSRELVILWCPRYFSRLWCVYEVAMFRALRPDGVVTWCPPFKQCFLVLSQGFTCLCAIGDCFAYTSAAMNLGLVALINLCFGFLAVHFVRPFLRDRKQLISQLEQFSSDMAECREAEDKEYIHESITHWYGSAASFDDHVRGPVKDLARSSECGIFELTPVDCFCVMWPLACSGAQWVAAYARTDMPLERFARLSTAQALSYIVGAHVSMKMFFIVVGAFTQRCTSRLADAAVDLSVTLLLFLPNCWASLPPDLPADEEAQYLGTYIPAMAAIVLLFYVAWFAGAFDKALGRE